MANQGYLAPNVMKNTQIAHGVSLLFKRDGTTNFIDIGDLSDVSITPGVEFLEYFSAHDAKNALAKRIAQQKSLSIECTVNEVSPETLRLAFFGGAVSHGVTSKTLTVIDKYTVPALTTGDVVLTKGDGLSEDVADITKITDSHGTITYVEGASADYQQTVAGITLEAASGGVDSVGDIIDAAASADHDIIIEYTYTETDWSTFQLLGTETQSGVVQFMVRNMEGGLAQIYQLDDALIAPSGAVPLPVDAVQSFPMSITAQVSSGSFGDVYFRNDD